MRESDEDKQRKKEAGRNTKEGTGKKRINEVKRKRQQEKDR